MSNKNIYDEMRVKNQTFKTAQEDYIAKLHTEIRSLLQQIDDKDKKIIELEEKIADFRKLIRAMRMEQAITDWLQDDEE